MEGGDLEAQGDMRRWDTGRLVNGIALAAVLIVVTWIQVLPAPARIDDHIAPDPGDPVLLMWIMQQATDNIADGPGDLLDANIFHPHDDTLAWSDNLLAYTPVWATAKFVAGGNETLAYNITALTVYVLGGLAMYLLARWLTRSRVAAWTAMLLFTLTPYRSIVVAHIQLAGVFTLLLALWFLFRLLRDRGWVDAVALGAAAAATFYTATYYTVLLAVMAPAAVAVWWIQGRIAPRWLPRGRLDPRLLTRGALSGVVAVILVAPVLPAYLRAQDTGLFERDGVAGAEWSYFTQLPAKTVWYRLIVDRPPVIGDRGGYFPGMLLIGGVLVAAAFAVRSRGPIADVAPDATSRWREFALPLLATSALATVLCFGPTPGRWGTPYRLMAEVVPGLDSVRDAGRFWLAAVIGLAVVAGVGVDRLARALPERWQPLVIVVVAVAIPFELAYRPTPLAFDTESNDGLAVYRHLDTLPEGVVTEGPAFIGTPSAPYVIARRQLRSLIDGNDRVEGYSGTVPPSSTAALLAVSLLPQPDAIDYLRSRDVRYVVVHVGSRCASSYAPEVAAQLVEQLEGSGGVRAVHPVPGDDDVIVELEPGPVDDPPDYDSVVAADGADLVESSCR